MPGIVHVVDDDASFRTAMERRLKKAGYEVVTYPSAQHLLDRVPNESELGCILLDVRITGTERSGASGSLERIRLDRAYRVSHWSPRCSDHGADHQGGCRRFSEQARIVGPASSRSRTGCSAS